MCLNVVAIPLSISAIIVATPDAPHATSLCCPSPRNVEETLPARLLLDDLFLQQHDPVDQLLRPGWTARNIDIYRNDLVHALNDGIGVEDSAAGSTCAHGDHPLWLRHLIVDPSQDRGHLAAHAAGHNHQVGLTWLPPKDLSPESGKIETRSARCHHLNSTAGKPKARRPD